MKALLKRLSPREQRTLLLGGSFVLLMVVYFGLIQPFAHQKMLYEQQVSDKMALLTWMHKASAEVNRLKGAVQATQKKTTKQSLLGLTESLARQHELGATLQRIQPSQDEGVQVWLNNAPFDQVLAWLSALSEYGIIVEHINIKRQAASGVVNVDVTLVQ